jgi:hypothetical protein
MALQNAVIEAVEWQVDEITSKGTMGIANNAELHPQLHYYLAILGSRIALIAAASRGFSIATHPLDAHVTEAERMIFTDE